RCPVWRLCLANAHLDCGQGLSTKRHPYARLNASEKHELTRSWLANHRRLCSHRQRPTVLPRTLWIAEVNLYIRNPMRLNGAKTVIRSSRSSRWQPASLLRKVLGEIRLTTLPKVSGPSVRATSCLDPLLYEAC